MEKLELTGEEKDNIPLWLVFPCMLAYMLSKWLGRAVQWMSGRVDGDNTIDICRKLLTVVQEEKEKGEAPDLVSMTGCNDLKNIIDPIFKASIWGFWSSLMAYLRNLNHLAQDKGCLPSASNLLARLQQYFECFSIVILFQCNYWLVGFTRS